MARVPREEAPVANVTLSEERMSHAQAVAWAASRGGECPTRAQAAALPRGSACWTADPNYARIDGHEICVSGHALKDATFRAAVVHPADRDRGRP